MKLLREHTLLTLSLSFLSIIAILIYADTSSFYSFIENISLIVRRNFGRFYLWLGLGCVLLLLGLAVSPIGNRRLGKINKPEYSLWAWTAMLYSAGMGAGILLRAVQEPVYMQQNPPLHTGTASETMALEYTFYQWGFTPWAFYGLFALIIGYYLFNRNKTVLASAAIEDTIPGKTVEASVDVLTILTTVFGLVAAVGLGTTQINGGLSHLFPTGKFETGSTIGLVLLISSLAFLSAWIGLDKGIKVLSKFNILVTLFLLAFVFFQTNIIEVFQQFFSSLSRYILDFIPMSLAIGKHNPGEAFLTDWTYYYWAFWLAWAPFTGIFIARISRGRTIRQLILGVLLIPSLGTFFWFTVFGENAFSMIESWGNYNDEFGNVFTSMFVFFEAFPLSGIMNLIIICLLVTFLVTSVDSAVFVLSMFTDKGSENPKRSHRLLWSIVIAIFGAAIILLGHAKPNIDVLVAMQKLLIITSLPFAFLTVLMAIIFIRDLPKK